MVQSRRRWAALAAGVLLPLTILTSCSSDDESQPSRDRLPDDVTQSGKLFVGTDSPYAPIVFAGDDGGLQGFDVDVVNAVAESLGVTVEFEQAAFGDLIPGVVGTEYDLAARGIFDTVKRQQEVDMVTYYSAGTQWASRSGDAVDPTEACGLRVGAQRGTYIMDAELPAKSQACTDAKEAPLQITQFENLDEAVEALKSGQVDALSLDSPVTQYTVKNSAGALQTAGAPFDTEPYGIVVAKDSPLGPEVRKAVQKLIDDGELKSIADKWGLGDGLIKTSVLNGATS